jgi:RimJ/RimL family protein N-acetyltransferase
MPAHVETFLGYLQDPEVAIYASSTFYALSPIPDLERTKKMPDEVIFTIFELENLTMIGECSLRGIDHRHGTATFGILIGRKEYWSHGYGTEATRLMLDYAFRFLNLHNVKLRTAGFNTRGQRAYQKAGFKEMGRRRSSILLGGKRYDDIYMDCVADEFEPPVPGWSIPFAQS